MAQLTCIVVTPEKTALEQTAEMVVVPLSDGEKGVAANHAPLIGKLGCGELRITSGGRTERYFIDGGFLQVAGNVVSVLTNRAIPASQLDTATAQHRLETARRLPADSPEKMAIRDREVSLARAQLRVSRKPR